MFPVGINIGFDDSPIVNFKLLVILLEVVSCEETRFFPMLLKYFFLPKLLFSNRCVILNVIGRLWYNGTVF